MKHSRLVSLVIAIALVVTSLGVASVAVADQAATNLTLWAFAEPHARYYEYIGGEYTKLHPNVTLTVELMDNSALSDRLKVCIAAGGDGAPNLADIEQGTFPTFMSKENMCFAPIEDLLKQDNLTDAIVQSRMNLYAYDGHFYGIEHALCPVMMVYRPDIFENNGIEVPTTWEEYKAAAEKLKENGIYISSEGDLHKGIPGIVSILTRASGNDIVTADGKFQLTDDYLNILDDCKKLIDDGCIYVAETTSDKYYEVGENHVATDMVADWAAGWLRDNVPEQSGMWKMTYLPKYNEKSARVSVYGGTGLCMLSYNDDATKATCWDFMKYAMLDPTNCVKKYQMISLYPPVYAAMEACNTPVEYYGGQNLGQLWQEVAKETPAQYQAAFRAKYDEVVGNYLYDYAEGNMSLEDFGNSVKSDMAEYMK